MNSKILTALMAAAVSVAGVVSQANSASAFGWNNNWTQSPIYSKAQTGFDDTPFQAFVQKEGIAIQNSGQFKVDPSKLNLKYDYNVSSYFINEGAGYHNQLAYSSTGKTNQSNLLFKDASCGGAGCVGGWDGDNYAGTHLNFGDGVKMGTIKGGSQLDFFLRGDGVNRGDNAYVYGTKTAANPDGLQHTVAYTFGKKYLMIGFEDLYGDGKSAQGKFGEGSDRDFNDTVFVVDIGEANVRALEGKSVPEPSVVLTLLGLGGAALLKRRGGQQAD
jgi:Domain of unknown function (DUF4114)/PEP-CTERM motif